MNKFKQKLSKVSNRKVTKKDLELIDSNQRVSAPVIDKFFGSMYRIHYNTYRQLKFFKSVDWYVKYSDKFANQNEDVYFFFLGDNIKKTAADVYAMTMRLRSDLNKFKRVVSQEYEISNWLSKEVRNNINEMVVDKMNLKVVEFKSNDQCLLFFESEMHGGELLKANYVFHTRRFKFDVS